MKQVIQASGVMPYEQYGFTNRVRFKDVLYLSGISSMDLQGRIIGDDIETQTVHTYQNIERVLRAAGSDLDRILQMTSFVVDLEKNGGRYGRGNIDDDAKPLPCRCPRPRARPATPP